MSLFRSAAFVVGGIAIGFVAAHFVNSTEQGRQFFVRVSSRVDEVKDAVKQGYEARTEAIRAAIENGAN